MWSRRRSRLPCDPSRRDRRSDSMSSSSLRMSRDSSKESRSSGLTKTNEDRPLRVTIVSSPRPFLRSPLPSGRRLQPSHPLLGATGAVSNRNRHGCSGTERPAGVATGATGVRITGLWLLAVRAGWLKLEVAVDKGQCAGSLPSTNASRSSGVNTGTLTTLYPKAP